MENTEGNGDKGRPVVKSVNENPDGCVLCLVEDVRDDDDDWDEHQHEIGSKRSVEHHP